MLASGLAAVVSAPARLRCSPVPTWVALFHRLLLRLQRFAVVADEIDTVDVEVAGIEEYHDLESGRIVNHVEDEVFAGAVGRTTTTVQTSEVTGATKVRGPVSLAPK